MGNLLHQKAAMLPIDGKLFQVNYCKLSGKLLGSGQVYSGLP